MFFSNFLPCLDTLCDLLLSSSPSYTVLLYCPFV